MSSPISHCLKYRNLLNLLEIQQKTTSSLRSCRTSDESDDTCSLSNTQMFSMINSDFI